MAEKSTYFANEGDVRERMRLNRQAKILDAEVDPLQGVDLSGVHDVLGVACGTGTWLIRYAGRYPGTHLVGLDKDRGMLAFAQTQAHLANANIDFVEADARQSLPFPDASFDLINARMIMSFMDVNDWPALLAECQRVLRPGGIICLTETESGTNNAYEYDEAMSVLYATFHKAHRTFASDPRQPHLCIGIALKKILKEAGFTHVRHVTHDVDFSYGEPAHVPVIENVISAFENGKQFFMKASGATSEQIDEAEAHIKSCLNKPGFLGFWHFISAIGYKLLFIIICIQMCYTAFIGLSC